MPEDNFLSDLHDALRDTSPPKPVMYHVTLIMPPRKLMRDRTGEVHFSHKPDTIERLKGDAVQPLTEANRAATVGPINEEDANTLARMLSESGGWWVCWCDE